MSTTPDLTAPLPSWPANRACKGADIDLFFPPTGGSGAQAKLLCRRCPIIDACLTWALAQPLETLPGVWGGTTRYQRRKMYRSDQPKHGVSAGQEVA